MDELNGRAAVYPGTFDPLTNGHVSLTRRACEIFDTVILGVANDTSKNTLFSLEERVRIARETFADQPKVIVEAFSGLTVDFALARGAKVLLRGLRAVSDFEYEFQLALLNRKMKREIQTLFLMTDYQWLFISSSIIKSAASLGGDIRGLVPGPSYRRLREKYGYPCSPEDLLDRGAD
jgi:pantetheine-phosphate adenylyltransferase